MDDGNTGSLCNSSGPCGLRNILHSTPRVGSGPAYRQRLAFLVALDLLLEERVDCGAECTITPAMLQEKMGWLLGDI